MRQWVCDRCNRVLNLSEVTMEFDYELCESCANELENIIDNFFKSMPVSFPNSEV